MLNMCDFYQLYLNKAEKIETPENTKQSCRFYCFKINSRDVSLGILDIVLH
jgi:hypothetical protein